jgi:hypothetical protein
MNQIEEAIAMLRMSDKPNIQKAADYHNVDRSTLSKRWHSITQPREDAYDAQRLLDKPQSLALISTIRTLTERGLPPTIAMVCNLALEICGRSPGKNWAARWIKTHKNTLRAGFLQALDSARKKADSTLYYKEYFDLLEAKIEQYGIKKKNTYNMDEKGFLIGFLKKLRRVYTKESFCCSRGKMVMQDRNREWITILATICSDNSTLSPVLIYQGATNNIQIEEYDPDAYNYFFASSPMGWTNNKLGFQWLTTMFDWKLRRKQGETTAY